MARKKNEVVTLANFATEEEVPILEPVESLDELEAMTLSNQRKNKEALTNLKNRVMLSLDQRKLKEAQKIIGGMENIGEIFSDPEIMERVYGNISTAMDMKFLSEAYAKLLDSQMKLMRMDSIDGQGTAAKISLAVEFAGGTKVSTVVKTEGN